MGGKIWITFRVVGKVEEIKDGNLIVSTPHGIKAIMINDDMDDIEEGIISSRPTGQGRRIPRQEHQADG